MRAGALRRLYTRDIYCVYIAGGDRPRGARFTRSVTADALAAVAKLPHRRRYRDTQYDGRFPPRSLVGGSALAARCYVSYGSFWLG